MDITLEKVDIIRDRTGVTYKEAKEALEAAHGNVVDALISIENDSKHRWTEAVTVKGSEAVEKVKNIVRSGNVNRIRIKKDETTLLDIPVTAGAISAVVIPQLTAIGTAVALLSKCTIEVDRPNKQPIKVNDMVSNIISETTGDVANKLQNISNDMKATQPQNQPYTQFKPAVPAPANIDAVRPQPGSATFGGTATTPTATNVSFSNTGTNQSATNVSFNNSTTPSSANVSFSSPNASSGTTNVTFSNDTNKQNTTSTTTGGVNTNTVSGAGTAGTANTKPGATNVTIVNETVRQPVSGTTSTTSNVTSPAPGVTVTGDNRKPPTPGI